VKPTEHEIASIPQFLELILHNPTFLWVYRGQSDISLPLLPKAGREEHFLKATDFWVARGQSSSDLGRFDNWRQKAVAFCEHLPENDFECLAFAQHYGLATRLLDWTENPLVALYFAVEEHNQADGAVFCYYRDFIIEPEKATFNHLKELAIYKPRAFDRRIIAQAGVFTYHPDPKIPLEAKPLPEKKNKFTTDGLDLVIIRIAANIKPVFQRMLDDIGISRKTLFPDLDGLSNFVNWQTRYYAKINKKNLD
jgi:hypothetical protein